MKPQNIKTAFWILITSGLISHVIAFFREIMIADKFGASLAVDAFLIAMIPTTIFIVISDALTVSFVPLFSRQLAAKGEKEVWKATSNLINVFMLFFIIAGCVYLIFAQQITALITPGFSQGTVKEVVTMIQIMFPVLILILPISISTAVLNSYEHFTYPAIASLLPNIAIILAALLLTPKIGVLSLAVGILLGYSGQFFLQFLALFKKLNKYYHLTLHFNDPQLSKFALFVFYTVVANGSVMVGIIVDRYFASELRAGTIAAMSYSAKIVSSSFHILIFAISSSTFPKLSKAANLVNKKDFCRILETILRTGLIFSIPIFIFVIVLRQPLIRFIFERGHFDAQATQLTSECMLFYTLSLFAFAGSMILTRGWYALHHFKLPALVGFVTIVTNILGDYFLVGPMAHKGLTLATSISGLVNFVLLLVLMQKRTRFFVRTTLFLFFSKIIFLTFIVGVLAWVSSESLLMVLNMNLFIDQILFFALNGFVIVVGFVITGLLLHVPEVIKAYEIINDKIKKISK